MISNLLIAVITKGMIVEYVSNIKLCQRDGFEEKLSLKLVCRISLNMAVESMLDIIIPCRLKASRLREKMLREVSPGIPLIVKTYQNTLEAINNLEYKFRFRIHVAIDSPIVGLVLQKYCIPFIYTAEIHTGGLSRCYEAAAILDSENILVVQGDEPCISSKYLAPIISRYIGGHSPQSWDVVTLYTQNNLSKNSVYIVTNNKSKVLYMSRMKIPSSAIKGFLKIHIGIYLFTRRSLNAYHQIECSISKQEDIELLRMITHGFTVFAECISDDNLRIGIDTEDDLLCYQKLLASQ